MERVKLYFAGQEPLDVIPKDKKCVEKFRLAVINGEQITYSHLDRFNYVMSLLEDRDRGRY
jgi:hypothetical protein